MSVSRQREAVWGGHPLKGWATSLELLFKDTLGSDPLLGLVQGSEVAHPRRAVETLPGSLFLPSAGQDFKAVD